MVQEMFETACGVIYVKVVDRGIAIEIFHEIEPFLEFLAPQTFLQIVHGYVVQNSSSKTVAKQILVQNFRQMKETLYCFLPIGRIHFALSKILLEKLSDK
jgi:hypothetical protein